MVCWEFGQDYWDGWGGWGVAPIHHPPAVLSVFWVQVLLAGLVVPLLLGATLTYTYHRCQPCKPTVPSKYTHAHTRTFLGASGPHG